MPTSTRTAQTNAAGAVIDFDNRTRFVENFYQRPALNADVLITSTAPTLAQMALRLAANRNFEVKGTNMTTALCTHSTRGGITLTTAGSSADQGILIPHADSGQTTWATTDFSTDDEVAFSAAVVTGASVSGVHLWAGLMLTSPATFAVGDDDDKVLFYYGDSVSNSNGNWEVIISIGGTDYQLDTGVSAAASTVYNLSISIDEDRYVTAQINDQTVKFETALTTGVDLIPTVGVEDTAGAAKAITVLPGYAISKTPNA